MLRVLLLLPTTTYRASDFLEAAAKLEIDVTVASEQPSTLEASRPEALCTLDFRDPEACARVVRDFASRYPVDGVVAVDEDTAVAAAAIERALGLPGNPAEAVRAARHKGLLRERLSAAGVPTPLHRVFSLGQDLEALARQVRYPCVAKPTFLAASRGVIRADNPSELAAAVNRIEKILQEPDVARRGGAAAREILVEDFVRGAEFAVEGLLERGSLRILALFDKPDPLDGPFFEETVYVTPSRRSDAEQRAIRDVVGRGADAIGLVRGPVHAEVRQGPSGTWLIEIAARSIGGLCSRVLRFGTGVSLEEIVLRSALRLPLPSLDRESRAAGVLMIPIPRAGVLEEVRGLDAARAVEGIVEVTITARVGQTLVPLPEGSRYLGFLFSRAESPESAEAALREAHTRLEFDVAAPISDDRRRSDPSRRSG